MKIGNLAFKIVIDRKFFVHQIRILKKIFVDGLQVPHFNVLPGTVQSLGTPMELAPDDSTTMFDVLPKIVPRPLFALGK